MSTLSVSDGSATNSSYDHDTGFSTSPRTAKVHVSSGERGFGPAENSGKSRVTYCPGGTRSDSPCGRLPWKPREIRASSVSSFRPSRPVVLRGRRWRPGRRPPAHRRREHGGGGGAGRS